MLPTNPLLNATAPAGSHLPTATLRQYAAGTLSPAAQHRVEAHTLACPRCADVLEGLLQTNTVTTDQALAQLTQRLRHRVLLAESAHPAKRARTSHRWLVPQLAAAATLLFGLVAGGWWTWQQRHPDPAAATQPTLAAPAPPSAPTAPAAPSAAATAASTLAATTAQKASTPRLKPGSTYAAKHISRHSAKAGNSVPKPSTPAATVVAPATVVATPPQPAPAASALTASPDSAVLGALPGPRPSVSRAAELEVIRVRTDAMPAAAAMPPMPVGGYSAWREQLRRKAAEFKPEAPDRPLSGTVRLRLLIGADGKLQEMRVVRGLRADYDAEAQRLVCEGPTWVPGVDSGKRAAQAVEVAVPFFND